MKAKLRRTWPMKDIIAEVPEDLGLVELNRLTDDVLGTVGDIIPINGRSKEPVRVVIKRRGKKIRLKM